MIDDSPQWFCFQYNWQKVRGEEDVEAYLRGVVQSVFCDDFIDIVVAGERLDDDIYETISENYFFVKCKNYRKHTVNIKRSASVIRVLPALDTPNIVPESEIFSFIQALSGGFDRFTPSFGDIVQVRGGWLEKLVGIILEIDEEQCAVWFKMYTKQMVEPVPTSNLFKVGILSDHIDSDRMALFGKSVTDGRVGGKKRGKKIRLSGSRGKTIYSAESRT